ncbi:MAG: hypothetical protein NTV51_10800 [Verrucomicrobia bacterium]|nr:hypothetical protein [Verrucomicrobiota bacterium]
MKPPSGAKSSSSAESPEATVHTDPTLAFDRAWANTLITHALRELEHEQSGTGRTALFGSLKEFLQRKAGPGEYDAIARTHGMTKGAVAAATHRLNRRFGELVRQNVRETVATPDLAEEELSYLFSTIGG